MPVNILARYTHWLHTRWPAGTVEKLPGVNEDGTTNVAGIRIVGDLTGIPLLKFSLDSGARAVQRIVKEPGFGEGSGANSEVLDVAIVGAGVSGMAAAVEAKNAGLRFEVFEATQPFSTIVNFPKAKPIYTYPTDMRPAGGLQVEAKVKEALLEELDAQVRSAGVVPTPRRITHVERKSGALLLRHADGKSVTRARRVIVAIGRSGNFRKLGCPGQDLDKVFNRLHDPMDFAGKNVLVVGGGDSALEAAIALAVCGARVTMSYRKKEFARPKPENIEKLTLLEENPSASVGVEHPTSERITTAASSEMRGDQAVGSVHLAFETTVEEVRSGEVVIKDSSGSLVTLPNDAVFSMIGREAPLDFFRRSGVNIHGEWRVSTWMSCILFVIFCVFLYHFKSNHPQEFPVQQWLAKHNNFPFNVPAAIDSTQTVFTEIAGRERNLLYTIKRGLGNPSFYYTLAYCTCVTVFGIRRMKRRPTPYVRWQTMTLIFVQCVPLFILPELVLPWAGRNGLFEPDKPLRWLADNLFESYDGLVGHERAYWRSYGFILAFPLNVYNVFTEHPMWLWLSISAVQTFVLIPLIIYRWGKGAYCGWICSCGALAETMGDAHRTKMPHGPFWNRVNMLGQAILVFALTILGLRIAGWVLGDQSWATRWFHKLFEGIPFLNYAWSVDIFFGGIIGVGLYFWFSGRVWCRFACPLAALMHIYTRFSRYRIFADKKKCISCNVCTSVCHQGIDIMNFANKGLPMEDPECVRCSACVQMCPTGVLTFGRYGSDGEVKLDSLPASLVQMAEKKNR